MEDRKIIAFIPVRGGSKGIPNKNIKNIGGKPLLHWVCQAALNTEQIDKVVLATDSKLIAETAQQLNNPKLEIFWRDAENCTDTASTEMAMLEYASKINDFTHMMLIQATSPLLESNHLEEAITNYFEIGTDSLIALVRQLKFIWKQSPDGKVEPINYTPLKRPRRQEFNGILTEPGAFYMTRRNLLLETKCRISGSILGYELPEELYFDLDTMLDWKIVETIFQQKINKK
jgi:N-acylneuraminate cytidylyltransferase